MNYQTAENQKVLKALVSREVITNQSYLVTELLKHHFDNAEWTNLYTEEEEEREVFEWWLVSSWLVEKLKKKGEVFVEIFGETWWGRGCTGQAVYLDSVMGSIGESMGILEGQEYHEHWREGETNDNI